MNIKPQLCIAMDVPTVEEARTIINELGSADVIYKIGYQLAFIGGLALADECIKAGKKIFLDLKLHDIGNTVESGVRSLANRGFSYLTVHSYPQTMQSAVIGKGTSDLKILAVSVLTSYNAQDLIEAGYDKDVPALVAHRAKKAVQAHVDGLVCSAQDIAVLKQHVGNNLLFVTPGIRPQNANADDQKRIMTPKLAIAAGASMLVVGRPITQSANKALAVHQILQEMEDA